MLYACEGQLRIKAGGGGGGGGDGGGAPLVEAGSDEVSAINMENLCLRGSKLKQTDWLIGVTVYAGMESKIQMNAAEATAKFPAVETRLNLYVNFIFVFILIMCVVLTIGTISQRGTHSEKSSLYASKQ
jgi:magnesium-transporting ATPase (P-type)